MLDSASHALRELLLDAGVATETQLSEMEEEQSRSGKSLFEVVTDFGMISEIDLMRLIADNLGGRGLGKYYHTPRGYRSYGTEYR